MRCSKELAKDKVEQLGKVKKTRYRGPKLNYDIESYEFEDLDLEKQAARLSERDQIILVLHLMGHSQKAISMQYSISRSTVSKRLIAIFEILKDRMIRDIDDLVAYLVENTSPGDQIVLTIVRGTQTLDLNVTLGVRPID